MLKKQTAFVTFSVNASSSPCDTLLSASIDRDMRDDDRRRRASTRSKQIVLTMHEKVRLGHRVAPRPLRPEHRGSDLDSVMVLVGSRVGRFKGPIGCWGHVESSTDEFGGFTRDGERPCTRSLRVQAIPHPRDLTHFQNLCLLEPEGYPDRMGVLVTSGVRVVV